MEHGIVASETLTLAYGTVVAECSVLSVFLIAPEAKAYGQAIPIGAFATGPTFSTSAVGLFD